MDNWVSVWGQAHTDISLMSPVYKNNTTRLVFRCGLSGTQLRVRFSNREGKKPYKIMQAFISRKGQDQNQLVFQAKEQMTVAPGEEICSDSLSYKVMAGELLQLDIAFEGKVRSGNNIPAIVHGSQNGNFCRSAQFSAMHRSKTACFHGMEAPVPAVSSIELRTENGAGTIVCFGDSITQQGNWTRPLERIINLNRSNQWAIVNKGIGGNRLLRGPFGIIRMYGRSGVERFERDALQEAGAKLIIFAIGTNDLAMARHPNKSDWVTAEQLQNAMLSLADMAKRKEIRFFAATIPPRMGSAGYLPEQEHERNKFNDWLRASRNFDGVLDFDAVLRDASRPTQLNMAFDSGDHLHPGPLGGEELANCVWKAIEGVI